VSRIAFGQHGQDLMKTTTYEEAKPILFDLIKNLQKQFDDMLFNNVTKGDLGSVSGTFISADGTPKTITVLNGIITSIK